jgi:segregation and condensation protein A
VMHRAELFGHHAIKRETLSVRQRMGDLLSRLDDSRFERFENLFDINEGRLGIVVTFLAMLELAKELLVEIVQEQPLGPIYVRAKASAMEQSAERPADEQDGESALIESSSE